MADAPLAEALAGALGQPVSELAPAGGGDINRAARGRLADGTPVFVKYHPDARPGTFTLEADGLRWLAEAGALRIPKIVCVGDDAEPRFLALEWIERGRPRADHDERLGRGLAALHRFGADGFGYPIDNLIGSLPQPNDPAPDWATFYGERRLLPMTRSAIAEGRLPVSLEARVERLAGRLPDLLGPAEPPSRLHGDLWSGNAMVDGAGDPVLVDPAVYGGHREVDGAGDPVLVDPAVYGGHREVDLAMMRLFGGFSERAFAAYAEAAPLVPGASERVRLLQLYPLLVHVRLFGGAYAGSVERAIAEYE